MTQEIWLKAERYRLKCERAELEPSRHAVGWCRSRQQKTWQGFERYRLIASATDFEAWLLMLIFVIDSEGLEPPFLLENVGAWRERDYNEIGRLPDDIDMHHASGIHWNCPFIAICDEHISRTAQGNFP
jgi:hypothetical protein